MEIKEIRTKTIGNEVVELKLVEGWNTYESQEVARKLLTHIIQSDAKHIRYGELAKLLDFECPAHFIDRYFGPLSYSCQESGLPIPSAMVVNDEFLPGNGFMKAYFPSEKDEITVCVREMKRVKEYKHWDIVLELFTGEK